VEVNLRKPDRRQEEDYAFGPGIGGHMLTILSRQLSILSVSLFLFFARSIVGEIGATETEVIWSTLYAVTVILIGSLGFAYVMAFILWYLVVVAGYLRRVTPIFCLDIQPEHGDGCGGLQRLGQVSLIIALVIAIPSVVIAILW
jgi:hypothetical protein